MKDQKYLEEKAYEYLPEKQMALYTLKEWGQMELAMALIRGYKANKGRAGYEQDYWEGKKIIDNVRAGK